VSFVVEVKSDLIAQWSQVVSGGLRWSQVEETGKALIPLRRLWHGHLNFLGGSLEIVDASTSRIPFVAVGFKGHKSLDALQRRLQETPESQRPDAVLVLESGAYVGLLTKSHAMGAAGLFSFCVDAAYFATNVLTAHPDFTGYFRNDEAAGMGGNN